MLRIRSTILVTVAVLLLVGFNDAASSPPIWPHPKTFTSGSSTLAIATDDFHPSSRSVNANSDIDKAFDRFMVYTFPRRAAPANATAGLSSIVFRIANPNATLQMYVNESYSLSVSKSDIVIEAGTNFGAYHALQTLSQLITFNFKTRSYVVKNSPWLIVDTPRFPMRSLLIDTGRHFLPVATLKQVIDSMSYAKFNVLHWHMVDAQSFPFDAPSNRNLAAKGAFSYREKYTTFDLKDVVEYARLRAVRIMMEIDVPGHFGGFCKGAPEACLIPQCATTNVNDYPMGIAFENSYDTVKGVLTDLTNVMPETLVHLGGDQPNTACWTNDPDTKKWLTANQLSAGDGYSYAVQRVQMMAESLGRQPVGWHEVWEYFGTTLSTDVIIEQRKSTPSSSIAMNKAVTTAGYRLLWGDTSRWYLDHLDVSWSTMYTAEPCDQLSTAQCNFVVGGEACMWGETVDASNIMQTIWPRAAAIAERLWSPQSVTDVAAATQRIAAFRCLLNARGIAASPLTSAMARSAPSAPGSCYTQ